MTILVTGASGQVGCQVVQQLFQRGASVRAFVRDPSRASFPEGVQVAQGDLLDVDALRRAFQGVTTLFLLNAVVPDEFTQALLVLNVAREAGVTRVVYLSVIHSDRWVDVPHFAGKFAVERMLEATAFGATILRAAYFMDNDQTVRDVIVAHGVYPMPIGTRGLAMVHTADLAEIAAIELLRRERAPDPLPLERINVVGPEVLTGNRVAGIWSDVLGRTVVHGGDDTAAFEKNLRAFMPPWMAYDMRLMADRFQADGMVPEAGDVETLQARLGRPLRSYLAFARSAA